MKIFGFAGYSNSGKTTLIEQLIPLAVARGLRVSLIKHAHHDFDVDQPGKDSWRHRHAGATEVLVASARRWALMHELRDAPEPSLDELVGRMGACDLLIVEGFKAEPIPRMEVWRPSNGKPRLPGDDPWRVALATDDPVAADETGVPVLDLNDPAGVLAWVLDYLDRAAAPVDPTRSPA